MSRIIYNIFIKSGSSSAFLFLWQVCLCPALKLWYTQTEMRYLLPVQAGRIGIRGVSPRLRRE